MEPVEVGLCKVFEDDGVEVEAFDSSVGALSKLIFFWKSQYFQMPELPQKVSIWIELKELELVGGLSKVGANSPKKALAGVVERHHVH
mmetsp:Transcript_31555/g.28735  ORF Transcript_31555/g.28735 Transcript_31555/m.28735 type:complete len:88 (+) Transcript_31555:1676-1939(+)